MSSLLKALSILALMQTAAFAQDGGSLKMGGISITGHGLKLIGTISTLSSDNDKRMERLGWGLIIVGTLIDARDLISTTDHSTAVIQSMNRECRVAQVSPDLAPSSAAYSAAEKLSFVSGKNAEEKVAGLCKVFAKVQVKAAELQQSKSPVTREVLNETAGTSDLSFQDQKALRNMFGLNGAV